MRAQSSFAVGVISLCVSACGGDGHHRVDVPGTDGAIVEHLPDGGTLVIHDGAVIAQDGAIDMDAAFAFDATVVPNQDDAGDAGALEDGSTPSTMELDAAADSATAPLGDASGPVSSDDAGPQDAASPPDAAQQDDAGTCPINDPRYGCGSAISPTWVRFVNGLEVDRANGLAWTPVRTPVDDMENEEHCRALSFASIGVGAWDVPEIEQVRTLAAGCDATVTGGSCQVSEMLVLPTDAGTCACAAGTQAPSARGFCRPEVSSCETIWTRTWCGPNTTPCPTYEHWFYDVTNGSIVLRPYGSEPANVLGRCVSKLVPPIP